MFFAEAAIQPKASSSLPALLPFHSFCQAMGTLGIFIEDSRLQCHQVSKTSSCDRLLYIPVQIASFGDWRGFRIKHTICSACITCYPAATGNVNLEPRLTIDTSGFINCTKSRRNINSESDAVMGSLPDRIEGAFTGIKELIHAALQPLPTQTGDGSYIEEKVPTHLFKDLHDMGFDGIDTLIATLMTDVSDNPTDDRTYLMENVVKVIPSTKSCSAPCGVADLEILIAGQWATAYLQTRH